MLRNWQEERLKSTSVAPYLELMDRYVIPIFSHMNFHASIMYGTPALLHIEQLEVRKSRKFSRFRDVVEARAILLDIENEGIEVANTAFIAGHSTKRQNRFLAETESPYQESRVGEGVLSSPLGASNEIPEPPRLTKSCFTQSTAQDSSDLDLKCAQNRRDEF
jgi:hypothetical protein